MGRGASLVGHSDTLLEIRDGIRQVKAACAIGSQRDQEIDPSEEMPMFLELLEERLERLEQQCQEELHFMEVELKHLRALYQTIWFISWAQPDAQGRLELWDTNDTIHTLHFSRDKALEKLQTDPNIPAGAYLVKAVLERDPDSPEKGAEPKTAEEEADDDEEVDEEDTEEGGD